jgi:hypothetical protein
MMMKYLTIMIMLLSNISLFGQVRNFNDIPKETLEQLDKMGVDNSLLLNCYESAYFNIIFKDSLNGFDFTNKKIGFIKAGSKRNKSDYFKGEKERFYRNTTTTNGSLHIFNATQKAESGGYDAVIVYWSKRLIPITDLVKRLKG